MKIGDLLLGLREENSEANLTPPEEKKFGWSATSSFRIKEQSLSDTDLKRKEFLDNGTGGT